MKAAQATKRIAPWRGRKRVAEAKDRFITVRCTASDYEIIAGGSEAAGLSIGGFLRALGTGSPGPRAVRRPTVDRVMLAQLLGEIGKLGSNVNQITKLANTVKDPPRWFELNLMRKDIAALRSAVMQALGRAETGLHDHGD